MGSSSRLLASGRKGSGDEVEDQAESSAQRRHPACGSREQSVEEQELGRVGMRLVSGVDRESLGESEIQEGDQEATAGSSACPVKVLKMGAAARKSLRDSFSRGETLEDHVDRVVAASDTGSTTTERPQVSSATRMQLSPLSRVSPSGTATARIKSRDTDQDEIPDIGISFAPGYGSRTPNRRDTLNRKATETAGIHEAEVLQSLGVGEPSVARSSGRQRKRPRRFSNDLVKVPGLKHGKNVSPPPPATADVESTKDGGCEDAEERRIADRLGFRDIQSPAKGEKDGRKRKAQQSPLADATARRRSATQNAFEPIEGAVTVSSVPDPWRSSSVDDETASVLHNAQEEMPEIAMCKRVALSRLSTRALVPLTNLVTEYAKVHSLLSATITAGEGNSMLVLGSRGSGKTNLIETAIADLRREHAADFHVVRLTGFRQTDDKFALREIWRQLGREMQVDEDETNQVSSYADTMASLLHLLSHPEEITGVVDSEGAATTTKSVVFILDEFDLFASHPRQTLLYNLFDIAQARKAPVAVIGCSTRVDVVDMLEKRIKSRFSHRWIHLAQPRSLQVSEDIVRAALRVKGSVGIGDQSVQEEKWNSYIEVSPPNTLF